MIAGLLILPFTAKPKPFIRMIRQHWKLVAWVTLFQTILNYAVFYKGMTLVPGALGAVIVGSQPLVTAVVASLMNNDDRLSGRKMLTIVFGISGVILISGGRQVFDFGTALELVGVLLILIGNVATATSNVLVSMKSNGMNPLVLSSISLFTGGLAIFVLSQVLETPGTNFPTEYWLVLLWLSFIAAFAFSLWYRLLQRPGVKVSELNLWKFIIPVIGAVLSWLFVPGEKPDWLTVTGMVIITSSLILFHQNKKGSFVKL
jgi:drug/metabolite transporter (DMT)-like permease